MRQTLTKALPFGLIDYDGDGVIEGYPAVFGNVDADGDVIVAGAFERTIRERGRKAVLGLDHEHGLGTTLELVEVGRSDLPAEILAAAPDATGGLYARGQVMLTPPNVAYLATMRKAIDDGVQVGMSFTYQTVVARKARGRYGRDVTELVELRLDEWGPALGKAPRNAAARLTGAKATAGDGTTSAKAIAGSYEDQRDDILAAVRGLPAFAPRADGMGATYIEAHYSDSVIVMQWADAGSLMYWRIPYGYVDGTVTLGEPTEVDVTTIVTVAAKAGESALLAYVNGAAARMKAGATMSRINLEDLDAAITALQAIRVRAVPDTASAVADSTGYPPAAKAAPEPAADVSPFDLSWLGFEIELAQTRLAIASADMGR